ncbi:hypothetical protein Slin15195_G100350 [Septoria linicola]|uniref:SET domain-containing protein n=1 Tax=Septoria linicola TaxID=215465 RepID=A0A9Q9EME0_9PEZI|nr:hypothetical protein Slin14017_G063380 [Septoria linicola]USW56716.1 hypothetical protein Slin15195_G100350 [Septoria linicola]
MDSSAVKHDRCAQLLEWAKQNGTFVHKNLKFIQTEHRGIEAIADPSGPGIDALDVLLRINYKTSFSYWNAIAAGKLDSSYCPQAPPLPRRFLDTCADHETVSAIFLVQHYLLGERSFWFPYIQTLPQPDDADDTAIPLIWEDEDLSWLHGTYLGHETPKQRRDLETRWDHALTQLADYGWDTTAYTSHLGLWAHYIFISRSFSTLAIEGDIANIKDEYHPIFKSGACIDDVPKVLLPILDLLNHDQHTGLAYDLTDEGLGLAKPMRVAPGQTVENSYDKDTQRWSNTVLLKDFGFILPANEFPELVLVPPIETTKPVHPSHVVFSTNSTTDDFYASSDEILLSFVTVRAPLRHPHGLVNPNHPSRTLRHFHPKLVSMVAFHVATLLERAALREDPDTPPSRRNQQATAAFLVDHVKRMLSDLLKEEREPRNGRQRLAQRYRSEQVAIIEAVLRDAAVQSESFLRE